MGNASPVLIFLLMASMCAGIPESPPIQTGAGQTNLYLPLLQDKRVGLLVNHTSQVGQTHLADTLLALDLSVARVFTPEHGFRGNRPDGEVITHEALDEPFELISLYGSFKRPEDIHLRDLDVVVIDLQDVGVRYYTYASTMTYMMEACAKNGVPILLLDRPNPNGSYVDGPVLDEKHESFIGLHPIPIVHGLTLGELARMINGEGWLQDSLKSDLTVIPAKNWTHSTPYSLPIRPSPNLPNNLAVALYPSLALFESTVVAIGRGTDLQFQVIGHPAYPDTSFSFIPQPNEGSRYPPMEGERCFGLDLSQKQVTYAFTLGYLIHFYEQLHNRIDEPFFSPFFARHAGNETLQKQIESGMSEEAIRTTWQTELNTYRQLRKKYLLYED